MLFARSGVAIDCDGDATRFMTSASLVKALNDKRKDHDNLKVGAANHPLLIFFSYDNCELCLLFFCFIT